MMIHQSPLFVCKLCAVVLAIGAGSAKASETSGPVGGWTWDQAGELICHAVLDGRFSALLDLGFPGVPIRIGLEHRSRRATAAPTASTPLSFEPTAPDYIVWAREGLVAGLTKIQQESLAGNNPCPVKFSKKGKGGWSRPRRDRLRFTGSDGKWGIEFVIKKWHSGSRPGFGLTGIVDCVDLGCCTGTLDNCGD